MTNLIIWHCIVVIVVVRSVKSIKSSSRIRRRGAPRCCRGRAQRRVVLSSAKVKVGKVVIASRKGRDLVVLLLMIEWALVLRVKLGLQVVSMFVVGSGSRRATRLGRNKIV